MEKIRWGIIGCGDVTEKKSGPAFNKVDNSELVAVMRRNADLARDYASRHGVPHWYSDADELIHDPLVNAIYIATPPDSHLQYTRAAIAAGKPVYLEKPMTLNASEAATIVELAESTHTRVSVAHYRRAQPYFKKIRSLLQENAIGKILFAKLEYLEPPLSKEALQDPRIAWRVNPSTSGGGLFHDLAPHQLDLARYFFGDVSVTQGISLNQLKVYPADDLVTGSILFESGTVFNGLWCFSVPGQESTDRFEIIGTIGKISFSVFGKQDIRVERNGTETVFSFEAPFHVQQPMIAEVVNYFLGKGPNPCSAAEASATMKMMDLMTAGPG